MALNCDSTYLKVNKKEVRKKREEKIDKQKTETMCGKSMALRINMNLFKSSISHGNTI